MHPSVLPGFRTFTTDVTEINHPRYQVQNQPLQTPRRSPGLTQRFDGKKPPTGSFPVPAYYSDDPNVHALEFLRTDKRQLMLDPCLSVGINLMYETPDGKQIYLQVDHKPKIGIDDAVYVHRMTGPEVMALADNVAKGLTQAPRRITEGDFRLPPSLGTRIFD